MNALVPATAALPQIALSPQPALERTREYLRDLQRDDGHWVGELQGDTILESEYILLLAILGHENHPDVKLAANYLLQHQQAGGGWSNYTDGPPDISISVKAYFALKIAGHASESPHMRKAREVILSLGGAESCNSFTKLYLAILGQIPYSNCPTVPVEMILLPRWFYFNIYAMSSWSRTIFVPLSIVNAYKPIRQLPEACGIREIFLEAPEKPRWPAPRQGWFSWTNFFLRIDQFFKFCERWRLLPFRKWALRKAVRWMREHYVESDGIGAIFPPMVYNAIVLKCLNVPEDDTEFRWAMKQLDDLKIYEQDTLRLQPCVSPVWDTALSLIALADCRVPAHSGTIQNGVRWLLDREIRRPGDWSLSNPKLEPGGWCFEYRNGFYPDTDDTSMVLMALARTNQHRTPQARPAVERAIQWLLGMQNRDGGWAAFDRDITRQILEKVPFADHNAMLDPSCPDITARVMESLGHFGFKVGREPIDRGLRFLEKTQEPNGSWKGRWGVNYLYGTWQVLQGLRRIGYDMSSEPARRAVAWLKSVQQESGAWGESCRSYDDPTWAGRGEPTASQTAWALLGLIAAGEENSPEVGAGIQWLLTHQETDGSWKEEPFTGTGFPKVFYLKYHFYSIYFPAMALGRYRYRDSSRTEEPCDFHSA